jgi:hypothetical protein
MRHRAESPGIAEKLPRSSLRKDRNGRGNFPAVLFRI